MKTVEVVTLNLFKRRSCNMTKANEKSGSKRGFASRPKNEVKAAAKKGGENSHGGGRGETAGREKERE